MSVRGTSALQGDTIVILVAARHEGEITAPAEWNAEYSFQVAASPRTYRLRVRHGYWTSRGTLQASVVLDTSIIVTR